MTPRNLFASFDKKIIDQFGDANAELIRSLLRFILFLVLYKATSLLWHYVVQVPFFVSFIVIGYHSIAALIVNITAVLYSCCYESVSVKANEIIVINNQNVIWLLPACTGLKQLFQILIMLLVYPIKFNSKLLLILPTLILIFLAAFLHFIILLPIAYGRPDWFSFSHNHLSKIIFFTFFFFTWLMWEKIKKNNIVSLMKDKKIK